MNQYDEIMKKLLKKSRYIHSLNVAKEAVRLAKLYGCDEKKAETAGLLHDICKNMTGEQQLQIINNSDIILDSVTALQPELWHSIAGAAYAERELLISDIEIITAIRYHTTARENMTLLEKIIYLSDLISEDRNYSGVEIMRQKVNESLDIAMREALLYIMSDLIQKQKPICEDTCKAYNQYSLLFSQEV